MSNHSLKNIALKDFEKFLIAQNCKCTRTKGGHKHYTRTNLNRPITLQSHIDPIPEFIVRNALRTLEMSKEDFCAIFFLLNGFH